MRSEVPGAALLMILTLTGCINSARETQSPKPSPVAAIQSDRAGIARAREDSARYPYTVADIRFMSNMIAHHRQAIVMSRWAPTHGASTSIRTLAERIINAQQDEIASIQMWLRDRGQPILDSAATAAMDMPMHTEHDMDMSGHEMLMPGMLTTNQMKQLDDARGNEFDRLFLTFMIQHHKGAVSMVNQLFSSRGAGQDETVFKFASDVAVDQSTEIERMERMLTVLTPG